MHLKVNMNALSYYTMVLTLRSEHSNNIKAMCTVSRLNVLQLQMIQVPDVVGSDDLPKDSSLMWLFLPFFYFPLVFAVVYSLGSLVYRIIK